MLEIADAHKFIRAHFDIDVSDDDVLIVQYMLAIASFEKLEPEFKELAFRVAAGVIKQSDDVMRKGHASIMEAGNRVEEMKNAAVRAADKAERLNAMLDERIATFDKRIAMLDERLDRTQFLATEMTAMANKTLSAVVALTSGLLRIRSKKWFSKN